jgi:hypothetical protein
MPRRALALAVLGPACHAARNEAAPRTSACKGWPWPDEGAGAWDHGGFFGKSQDRVVQPRAHYGLKILGTPTTIPPLPKEHMSIPGADSPYLNRSVIDQIATEHVPTQVWARVARLAHRDKAKVVVLGCSTTSGCGGSEEWELWRHQSKKNDSQAKHRCDPTLGWARRLADALAQLQEWHGFGFEVEVQFKNAVRVDYFSHCTSSYVPRDAHVVLLEVAANVWGHKVDDTLKAVRAVAPHAAIVFVNWGGRPSEHALVREGAKNAGADIVHLPKLKNWLQEQLHISRHMLFAQRGADVVHPSPSGHALIGAVTARFIGKRLVSALCEATGPAQKVLPEGTATNEPTTEERCFPEANKLPVVSTHNGSWSLVDDGGSKGVQKLGLLSTQINDVLELEPWPAIGCFVVHVQLGYLVSARRPNLGGFMLSCDNCACVRKQSPYPKQYPFPDVQTDARYADDAGFMAANMTVTAMTEFLAFPSATQQAPCRVRLQHIPASARKVQGLYRRKVPSPERTDVSQIRIDSLSAMLLTNGTESGREEFRYMLRKGAGSMRLLVRDFLSGTACPAGVVAD